MQKSFFLITLLTLIVFASGCQTIFSESTGISPVADISTMKGSKSHEINVEVDESLRKILRSLYFYNVTEAGKKYILVSGSVKKPMGESRIDRKKVNARFLNATGDILAEGTDKISISRMRRPTGSKGKFSIKVPYHSDIKKCIIAFQTK